MIGILPLLLLKEVYTPFRLVGIKIFKCQQDGKDYVKVWKKSIKRIVV